MSDGSGFPASRGSIVFVDDEKDIVYLFRQLLQKNGFDVTVFSDPLKALAYFTENSSRISLLITDLKMPQMSGIELASRVRQVNPNAKILLMTAFETTSYEAEIDEIKIDSVLRKPVTPANFKMTVEKIMCPPGSWRV